MFLTYAQSYACPECNGNLSITITNKDIQAENGDDKVINITHHATGAVAIDGGTGAGQLRLYEPSGTDPRTYVALKAGVGDGASQNEIVLTLPHEMPAEAGQVLKATMAGVLYWGDDEAEAGATNNTNKIVDLYQLIHSLINEFIISVGIIINIHEWE